MKVKTKLPERQLIEVTKSGHCRTGSSFLLPETDTWVVMPAVGFCGE